MKFEFSNKDLLAIFQIEDESTQEDTWKLYFDGASNALAHGIGAVLISSEGEYYPFIARLNFDSTNNMAEYEACVIDLQAAMAKKVKKLKVYEDSALVIYQLQGDWLTRDSQMILYHKLTMEMVDKFEVINFEHLLREENQMTDALATLAAMFQTNSNDEVQLIRISIKEEPTHCLHIEKEVDGRPWYYDILQYVKNSSIPKPCF